MTDEQLASELEITVNELRAQLDNIQSDDIMTYAEGCNYLVGLASMYNTYKDLRDGVR